MIHNEFSSFELLFSRSQSRAQYTKSDINTLKLNYKHKDFVLRHLEGSMTFIERYRETFVKSTPRLLVFILWYLESSGTFIKRVKEIVVKSNPHLLVFILWYLEICRTFIKRKYLEWNPVQLVIYLQH